MCFDAMHWRFSLGFAVVCLLIACPSLTSEFCGAAVPAARAGETPAPQVIPGQPLTGCFLATAVETGTSPPVARPAAVDHSQLLVYQAADGRQLPVRTTEDWGIRRQQILKGMESVMGELSDRSKLPPLDVQVLESKDGDTFVRLNITYVGDEDHRVPAHLYLPKSRPAGQRVPGIVALHPTSPLGKQNCSGEAGTTPNRGYAAELARRGYVVLAPDYPSFGDYACDFTKSKRPSGTVKGIVNHMRGVDLLQAREEVDPERIGTIGHSLGGHNAIFLGVFDPRVKVIVSSSGWTPFHDYYGGKLAGWTSPCYMPRIRDVYACDADRVPFDFYELVAALAPRAFFSNSPIGDANFDYRGVQKAEPKVREIFALLGAPDRLQIRYSEGGHDFSPDARRDAYAFIDRILQHSP